MIDLSIIIPTYNRPRYLNRILSYYSNSDINCRIIIADSSIKENKVQNQKIVKSHKNMNVLYLNDFESDITPMEKIFRSIQMVNETYCVFCADDDFITPNAIKKCVDFLEKNPEYACAHGDYVGFKLYNEKNTFLWKKGYLYQKSITDSDPKLRLRTHMSNYMQTFYSVHKTDILKKSLEEGNKYTNDLRFAELLPSMLTLIYGKMKKLDVLYGVRESIPYSGGATASTILSFTEEGSYKEKYEKFRTCLAKHLSKKAEIDVNEAETVIDKSWQNFLNSRIFKKSYSKSISTRMNRTLTSFNLPKWLDNIIREYYNKTILKPIKNNQWNITIPDTNYYKDLKIIKKHVLKHHNGYNQ